jgi:cytoskeletal protein CcmA (bactofilin family)
MNIKALIAAVGLAAIGLSGPVHSQVIGGDYRTDGSMRDIEVLAGDIAIRGHIEGSVEAIGGEIDIDARVDDGVEVVGGDIRIAGVVGEDVEAMGGEITIAAEIGGGVEAAGGEISFGGSVGENVEMAAGELRFLEGSYIAGDLYGAGEYIRIAGTIDGDVHVLGVDVIITDTAVINGYVEVEGPEAPIVEEGATLAHPVEYEYRELEFGLKHLIDALGMEGDLATPLGMVMAVLGMIGLFVGFTMFMLGAFSTVLLPNSVGSIALNGKKRPFMSLLVGLVSGPMLLILAIVMSILLGITVIGSPLIPIVWLAYILIGPLAFGFGGVVVGNLLFNRKRSRPGMGRMVLSLAIVSAIIAALWVIPPLAVILTILVYWMGLGSWVITVFNRDVDDSESDALDDRSEPDTKSDPEPEPEPDPEPASDADVDQEG